MKRTMLLLTSFILAVSGAGWISITGSLRGRTEIIGNGSRSRPLRPTVDIRDVGAVDCTGTAASDGAFEVAVTAGNHVILPQGCIIRLASNESSPANVSLNPSQGTCLKPDTGIKITILGDIGAGRQQIFCNALESQGAIDFTGNAVLEEVYPEWWGASPTASATTNTRALQAAIYGAYGCNPKPATSCRTNASGLAKWNKVLKLADGVYNINDELKFNHILNYTVLGEGGLWSRINQTAGNKSIFRTQGGPAFGTMQNMGLSSTATQDTDHPLAEFDWDGTAVDDLRPEFNTFRDFYLFGNGTTAIGIRYAKSGGGAQSSNIQIEAWHASGFLDKACSFGTPATIAYNAITIEFGEGDCASSPHDCIYGNGLSQIHIHDVSFEDASSGTQTGCDVVLDRTQVGALVENVRSESFHVVCGSAIVRNTQTVWKAATWDQGSLAGTAAHVGDLIAMDSATNDGAYYHVTRAGTWGGMNTTQATGGSLTTIVCGTCSWTIDQWKNMRVGIVGGHGKGAFGIVRGNTATTIKVAAWTSFVPEGFLPAMTYGLPPDSSSRFVVEPDMANQTISGSVMFAKLDGYAIGPGETDPNAGSIIDGNVIIHGLPIKASPNVRGLRTTRRDWYGGGSAGYWPENLVMPLNISDVQVFTGANGAIVGAMPQTWHIPRNGIGNGAAFYDVNYNGTTPQWWSMGEYGGGASISDVGIDTDSPDKTPNSGRLRFRNNSSGLERDCYLNRDGSWQCTAVAFSELIACTATNEGSIARVTDSSTVTWGATITGGSTNHVLAYCDGSSWTVAGK